MDRMYVKRVALFYFSSQHMNKSVTMSGHDCLGSIPGWGSVKSARRLVHTGPWKNPPSIASDVCLRPFPWSERSSHLSRSSVTTNRHVLHTLSWCHLQGRLSSDMCLYEAFNLKRNPDYYKQTAIDIEFL